MCNSLYEIAVESRGKMRDFADIREKTPKEARTAIRNREWKSLRAGIVSSADIRKDLPRYRIWEKGILQGEPTDITDWWKNDLVGFLVDCSFSFENALMGLESPYDTSTSGATSPSRCGPFFWSSRSEHASDPDRAIRQGCNQNSSLSNRARRPRTHRRSGDNRDTGHIEVGFQ